jgi:myo-inositol-1(or 4)-monophosphatase
VRDYNDLVAVAADAGRRAARLIRQAPAPPASDWSEKTRHDFVTNVDRDAERLIADVLAAGVPGSSVMGEELTPGVRVAPARGVVWIVDPLDGTTNFLHGYPQYAVSIAAWHDDALVAGVVLDVAHEHLFSATRGGGAQLDGRSIHVSAVTEPARALVGTGYPFKHLDLLDRYLGQFRAVLQGTSGVRRAGSAALDLADVACGRFDAFWELSLAPWDVAAGTLLVREAGGIVTTLEGQDDVLHHGSIVAGNPVMHRWLLDTVGKQ